MRNCLLQRLKCLFQLETSVTLAGLVVSSGLSEQTLVWNFNMNHSRFLYDCINNHIKPNSIKR